MFGVLLLLVCALAVQVSSVAAQDEKATPLEDFFPLVTRRPVLEQEFGVHITGSKGREGRAVQIAPFLAIPILPRWQVELDVPALFRDPRQGAEVGGAGDLEVENKFVLWQSKPTGPMLSGGVAVTLPTGSGARHLGGETAVEPFLSAGLVRRRLYLVAALSYDWTLNAPRPGPPAQTLTSGAAIGYLLRGRVILLLDVSTVTKIRGADAPGTEDHRGPTQVYLTPGVNVQVSPAATLSLGVQLPVTRARAFDYTLHGVLDWSF